jgi:hypothetical protein
LHLKKPFFDYSHGSGTLFPDVDEENARAPKTVERHDHISANGKRLSYLVGARDFIESTFRWQSDALRTSWHTMWDAIKNGSVFQYHEDADISLCGDGTVCGDGSLCGADSEGDATVTTAVTVENTELTLDQEEIDGYWVATLTMREDV